MAFPLLTIAKAGIDIVGKKIKEKREARKEQQAKKKSGSQMASAFFDRKESRQGVQTQTTTPLIAPSSNIQPAQKAPSGKSSGVSSIDTVLDEIDNTLFNMINLVADSSKLKNKVSSQQQRTKRRRSKKMREGILEGSSSLFGKIGSAVTSPIKGAAQGLGKMLSQFFGNIILGSLALFVVNSWGSIVFWFKKGFEKIKELWEALGKGLKSTWDGLKWIVSAGGGQDLVKKAEEDLKIINGDLDKNEKKLSSEQKKVEKILGKLDNESPDESPDPGDKNQPSSQVSFVERFFGIRPVVAGTLNENQSPLLNDQAKYIFDRLVAGGLTDIAAGGVVANLGVETGYTYNPSTKQGGGGLGRGLAQWEKGGRFDTDPINLVDFAKSRGTSWNDLDTQIDFILHEMNVHPEYIKVKAKLNNAKNVDESTKIFLNQYEKAGTPHLQRRLNVGQAIMDAGYITPNRYEGSNQLPKVIPDLPDVSFLRNQASYDMAGGTTIIMMGGDNKGSTGGQEGSTQILPIPLVNSIDYTLPFKVELSKVG